MKRLWEEVKWFLQDLTTLLYVCWWKWKLLSLSTERIAWEIRKNISEVKKSKGIDPGFVVFVGPDWVSSRFCFTLEINPDGEYWLLMRVQLLSFLWKGIWADLILWTRNRAFRELWKYLKEKADSENKSK